MQIIGPAIVGGGLLLLGLIGVGGRVVTVIDKSRRQIREVRSFFRIPVKTKTFPLAEANRLVIEKRIQSRDTTSNSSSSRTITYPLKLVFSDDDSIDLRLNCSREQSIARAEILAEFMNLEIIDASQGLARAHQPGSLDQSLREQAADSPEGFQIKPPPRGSRIRLETHEGGVVVTLPRPHEAIETLTAIMDHPENAHDMSKLPGIAGKLLGAALEKGRKRMAAERARLEEMKSPERTWLETVRASPAELLIRFEDKNGAREDSMSADEIKELELGDSLAEKAFSEEDLSGAEAQLARREQTTLRARGDNQKLEFAKGLSLAEAQWLRDLLRHVLSR